MLERILEDLEGESIYDLDPDFAREILAVMDTRVGKLILRHLDREEFQRYEEDIVVTDHDKTLVNKGYIQGIRSVRSLFQEAYRIDQKDRQQKQKEQEKQNGRTE